jgi:hypothetical protein
MPTVAVGTAYADGLAVGTDFFIFSIFILIYLLVSNILFLSTSQHRLFSGTHCSLCYFLMMGLIGSNLLNFNFLVPHAYNAEACIDYLPSLGTYVHVLQHMHL